MEDPGCYCVSTRGDPDCLSCSDTPCAGKNKPAGKNGQAAVSADRDLVIPISEISATAKFYPISIDGTRMEVLAVKAPDGTIRTAFNTCQVCYSSGRGYYRQLGNVLICQNCGNQFTMSRVGVAAGGCNPWPIFARDRIETDKSITIPYAFLKKSKGIFANWKSLY